jgi:hypothetical protein
MGGAPVDSGPAAAHAGGAVTARTWEVRAPDAQAPVGSERERERTRAGACGPARGKENWVGPKETVRFLIYSN